MKTIPFTRCNSQLVADVVVVTARYVFSTVVASILNIVTGSIPRQWLAGCDNLGRKTTKKSEIFSSIQNIQTDIFAILTALKLFLHNSNRMLLVLLEIEYNIVWLTRIKNSIFKRYIIVIFDILKCWICHTVPYRWGPLCHSIGYIVTSCVKDTLKCETWIIFKDNEKITVYYYYVSLAINWS